MATYYQFFLKHPFGMGIFGPSGCGKTEFVKKLIYHSNECISPPPKRILYYYTMWQKGYEELRSHVTFIKGLDDSFEDFIAQFDTNLPALVIFDDMMREASNSSLICDFFTKGSHHANVSGILISQNFYSKGSRSRDILLNIPYIVLMKNPRDRTIVRTIGSQIFPGKTKQFVNIYDDATQKPYSYLFLDFKPDTPNEIRILSNIFAEPPLGHIVVYKI